MGLDPRATSFSVRGATVGVVQVLPYHGGSQVYWQPWSKARTSWEQASESKVIARDVASPARSADVSNSRIPSAGGQNFNRRPKLTDAGRLASLPIPAGPESDSGRRILADVCSAQVRKLEPGSEAIPRSMSNSDGVLSASLKRRRKSEAQPRIGSVVTIGTLNLDQGKVEDGRAIRTTLNSSKETGKVSSLDVSSTSSTGFRREEIECSLWPVDRGFILPDGVCTCRECPGWQGAAGWCHDFNVDFIIASGVGWR
ncbi:hypothetical protein R1flu_004922 [Riccia fluitans]|uniref:Uncharacterized protein n=1 Tax=Riccia fluitans TaxID=41844 RepID=A0ABD1YSA4_9MARC